MLTTPVIRCVRQQVPDAEVHLLTKAAYRSVVAASPYLDCIHTFDQDLDRVVESLKAEQFDAVVDLHRNLRSARVKRALGVARTYAFPKLNVRKWLLTALKIQTMPDQSIVERYFEAAAPLGVRNDGKGLDCFIPEAAVTAQDDIPMGHWAGYVGCVIGGSYETKKLPAEQWQAFAAAVPYPLILLGGPEDRDLGRTIAAADPDRIYNACGKFNLMESADLVRRAKVIVSNDTGLMHVAAAFKKPIVSLWGNTVPEFGMYPYYGWNNLKTRVAPESVLVERDGLSCRPCSKLGYGRCPKGHFKCMRELNMDFAANAVKKLWDVHPT